MESVSAVTFDSAITLSAEGEEASSPTFLKVKLVSEFWDTLIRGDLFVLTSLPMLAGSETTSSMGVTDGEIYPALVRPHIDAAAPLLSGATSSTKPIPGH